MHKCSSLAVEALEEALVKNRRGEEEVEEIEEMQEEEVQEMQKKKQRT